MSRGGPEFGHRDFIQVTVRIVSKFRRRKRQIATALFSLSVLVAASGCSVTGPVAPETASTDSIVTDSVVAQAKPQGVEKTDAEIIKTTVAASSGKTAATPLAWSNPQTGSSGAIVAIDQFMGKHGQTCRGFKTTVATFMGIAFYDGEACQISPGEWVLSWFKSAA